MTQTLIDHPFFLMLVSAVVTLILKILYDRYWAPGSRVTYATCKQNQLLCAQKFTAEIQKVFKQLSCGDEQFEEIKKYHTKTDRTLRLILIAVADICTAGNGCDEETKSLLREELRKT